MPNETYLDKALLKVFGLPQPKQADFMLATERYVGYGGARGGGKSYAVRYKATALAYANPGIKILIVRKTMDELRGNYVLPLLNAYAKIPKDLRPEYKSDPHEFWFPMMGEQQSIVKLAYCDTEADAAHYIGQEFDVIFMDEATTQTEKTFHDLDSCIRGANPFPKRMYITCNPGGVGHSWVLRLFIEKKYHEADGERAEDYHFIQAKVWDNLKMFEYDTGFVREMKGKKKTLDNINAAIMKSDYVRSLKANDEQTRKAWIDGDWYVFQGQFFPEFSRTTHVCKTFTPPSYWKHSSSIDYGLDTHAVLWFAVDPDGFAYVYREYAKEGLTIPSAARITLAQTKPEERIYEYYAPSDLWSRDRYTGVEMATTFAMNNMPLIQVGRDRIPGWARVKEYFEVVNWGKGLLAPRLKIMDCCTELIDCIERLQYDPKKIQDAAEKPHEITHLPSALRYWCSRHQGAGEIPKVEPPDPWGMNKEPDEDVSEDYLIGGFHN